MPRMAVTGVLLTLLAGTTQADPPEPIHHDEPAQPTIEPMSHLVNATTEAYVMGHLEPRQVAARPVDVCYQLTDHVVNEDFMKCRHGYTYQAWVPGHYIKASR